MVKETKVETMATTIEKVIMFEIGNNIVTTTSTETTMEIGMIELGHMSLLKIGNLLLVKVEVLCQVLRIRCKKG